MILTKNSEEVKDFAALISLPPGWCWIPFEEITINYDGKRVPITSSARKSGVFPYYGASGIIDYVDDYLFDGDYLLIAEDGANLLSRSTPIAFEANGKFWVNNHAHIVQVPGELIPLSYLKEYFNSTDLRFYISGSAQPKLNQKNLNRIEIPLAPLNELRRIVAKIEALKARSQRVKEELEAIPALLNQFRQSVLAAAFRGDLTADWREKNPDVEPASVLLERIHAERRRRWEEAGLEKMKAQGKTPKDDKWKEKYEEPEPINTENLQDLPEGWSWTNIDNLSFVVRGASPRPAGDPKYFGGDIPWITVAEITKDEEIYLTSTSGFVTEEGRKASRFIETGSLLLTNSGATLGVPKITQISGCINDGSVALLFVTGQLQIYLYYFLKSLTHKLRIINQGAAQPNLNTTIVRNIMVPLPPYEEQQVIIEQLKHQLSTASKIETLVINNLEITETLNQSILAKAFRGELVPQDPNDEPASVLLEGIQAGRQKREAEAKTAKKSTGKKGGRRSKKAEQPEGEAIQLEFPLG